MKLEAAICTYTLYSYYMEKQKAEFYLVREVNCPINYNYKENACMVAFKGQLNGTYNICSTLDRSNLADDA